MIKNQYKNISFPYGETTINISCDLSGDIDIIFPTSRKKPNANFLVQRAIDAFNGTTKLALNSATTVAIAVNDPTRPIPNHLLLPPLLKWLQSNNIRSENITFFIATGTHKSPSDNQIREYLPINIPADYRTLVHNCDEGENLLYIGETSANTPVYVNKQFYAHDIKITVGHIEPHHFMGYSGGAKSAAIGLTGRSTITSNHKMLTNPSCKMGRFYNNPMRLDVEEIGELIGVDLSLNVVLNDEKVIQNAFFDRPYIVMEKGIRASKIICEVDVKQEYDLVICSAGGYPKDINLYQAQKAITHACTFLTRHGAVILIAECLEGLGSTWFEQFFDGKSTPKQVIKAFEKTSFTIGPHKAYQLSLQTEKHRIFLVSALDPKVVRKLFLYPAADINNAILMAQNFIPSNPKIALLPFATHIMKRTEMDIFDE